MTAAYASLELTLLVQWCTISQLKTNASVASAAISLIAAIAVCTLSHFEHGKSLRPSLLLTAYLFITFLFDIVRTRTMWQAGETTALAATFTLSLVVRFTMMGLENVAKRRYLDNRYRDRAQEELSGFFSLTLFLWLNDLMRRGFQRWLAPEDLNPINRDLSSEILHTKFQTMIDQPSCECCSVTPQDRSNIGLDSHRYHLIEATLKSLKWPLIAPVFPRLCLTAFTFVQPFLLNTTLNYLQNTRNTEAYIGKGLVVAYVLVYIGIAVSIASIIEKTPS